MPSLTIRLRTEEDRDAVERLKQFAYQPTASRAIMEAVRKWPIAVEEVQAERKRNTRLADALDAVLKADAEAERATSQRDEALAAARAIASSSRSDSS